MDEAIPRDNCEKHRRILVFANILFSNPMILFLIEHTLMKTIEKQKRLLMNQKEFNIYKIKWKPSSTRHIGE